MGHPTIGLAGSGKNTPVGSPLRFAVGHCSLHHDLLYMAGVLKRIAVENDYIRILAFAE
jgi:hypothetical protein